MNVNDIAINALATNDAVYTLGRSTERVWLQIDYTSVANSNGKFSVQTSINGASWGELLSVDLPNGTSSTDAITISVEVPGKLLVRLAYTKGTTSAGTYTIRSLS